MIQPGELKLPLPIDLSTGKATTTTVWEMLMASRDGNLDRIQELVADCPALAFCKYNYTPPIHFAVREGHLPIVQYLLNLGAHDPDYRTYPFKDDLTTIAEERGYQEIAILLHHYLEKPEQFAFRGELNGRIHYERTPLELDFESAVDKGDLMKTGILLKEHPELVLDDTFFWGEGILAMPAHDGHREMVDLLLCYGARVPAISKWGQYYYFERYDMAGLLLDKGMNPDHKTWHHVTLLHDMAQKGDVQKANLLIRHGADIDPIEEEYQSTPLGLAVRWGHADMVKFLLQHGADPRKSGAAWSTPLTWAKSKGYTDIESLLIKAYL